MNEKTKNHLVPAIITLVFCLFCGAILYYYFSPFLIKEIDKFDLLFTWRLYLSLVLWILYLWIIKVGIKIFKFKETQGILEGVSIYFVVLGAWLSCFTLSGVLYLFLQDTPHAIDYSIVSFLISMPYVTSELIKYYVLDKNKNHQLL
ncbi:hypothetical protein [Flavobacterium frigoris]|uniref:Uncharacterized protein n=1 Tax=Flavobacterium frigoris (strain PS1) TaxID=1086011 RepID=H7FPA1_FLAFP|nr:hypothetical protein [Flavobacterium frigoris]EIA09581.1 hypothetical protein HJ01_00999 [Flavobacterium frigoris PS1]